MWNRWHGNKFRVWTTDSKNVETTENQKSKRSRSRCSQPNHKFAHWTHRITKSNISVGFILVFTCSFGPLEAFHIMRAIGWDVIPIRKCFQSIEFSMTYGHLVWKWKSDNFCQQLETISSVLPWISPGWIIYLSLRPPRNPNVFYFSFEPIDLFIFWSKLSSSNDEHHSTIHQWRTDFSRHSACSVKVYFHFGDTQLRHQLSDIFRLVRVKTFVQRTTTEYDDNGRELEHGGTKEGILI